MSSPKLNREFAKSLLLFAKIKPRVRQTLTLSRYREISRLNVNLSVHRSRVVSPCGSYKKKVQAVSLHLQLKKMHIWMKTVNTLMNGLKALIKDKTIKKQR